MHLIRFQSRSHWFARSIMSKFPLLLASAAVRRAAHPLSGPGWLFTGRRP